MRTVGGSLGIALLGAVYTGRMQASLAGTLGPEAAHRMAGGGGEATPALVRDMPVAARRAFHAAVTSGLHGVLIGTAVLAVIAFAAAWLVREVPLRTEAPSPDHSGPEAPPPAYSGSMTTSARTPPSGVQRSGDGLS